MTDTYPLGLQRYGQLRVTPFWKTVVKEYEGGQEQRDARWLTPRFRFDLSYGLLEDADQGAKMFAWQTLFDFYMRRKGRYEAFYFQDWTHIDRTNEFLGVTNGVRTLYKVYEDKIGTAFVYKDGVVQVQGTPRADNFTRADADALGGSWVEDEDTAATVRILTNQLRLENYVAGILVGLARYNVLTNDQQFSELTFKAATGNGKSGPAVRIATASTRTSLTGYAAVYNRALNQVKLKKFVAQTLLGADGGTTLAGPYAVTLVSGDKLRIEALGTLIRVLVNGTQVLAVTDASIASGQAGVVIQEADTTAVAASIDWDDWNGGDLIDVTVDVATGKVTFRLTPAAGSVVTADVRSGFFKVRFDMDDAAWERILGGAWSGGVSMLQVRENV